MFIGIYKYINNTQSCKINVLYFVHSPIDGCLDYLYFWGAHPAELRG